MLTGFLKEIDDGEYRAELTPFVLKRADGTKYEGMGFLKWNPHDGVSIEALTDGGEDFTERFFGPRPRPGTVLWDDYYCRLEGTIRKGGWSVSAERVDPDTYTVSGNPTALCRLDDRTFYCPLVFTEERLENRWAGVSDLLFSRDTLPSWPRGTRVVRDEGPFAYSSSLKNWLEYDCGIGKVSAEKLESGRVRLRIEHTNDDSDGVLEAVRMAFSFIGGQMTNIVATECHGQREVRRKLRLPFASEHKQRFVAPLGIEGAAEFFAERLLAKATDYFYSADGRNTANRLYSCYDSVNNTFTTHAMVVCSSLEAMLKPFAKALPRVPALTADEKLKLEDFLTNEKFGESGTKRLLGFVNTMDAPHAKSVLLNWSNAGKLGEVAEDIKAWDETRNNVMHGKLLLEQRTREILDKEISFLRRLTNLINKLVLNAIGFEGNYFDYTIWAEAEFPKCKLN